MVLKSSRWTSWAAPLKIQQPCHVKFHSSPTASTHDAPFHLAGKGHRMPVYLGMGRMSHFGCSTEPVGQIEGKGFALLGMGMQNMWTCASLEYSRRSRWPMLCRMGYLTGENDLLKSLDHMRRRYAPCQEMFVSYKSMAQPLFRPVQLANPEIGTPRILGLGALAGLAFARGGTEGVHRMSVGNTYQLGRGRDTPPGSGEKGRSD